MHKGKKGASANIYDKSFKEFLAPRVADILNRRGVIQFNKLETVPFDVHTLLERKPDFLVKYFDDKGQAFILHVEYQSSIDPEMPHRMHIYAALIHGKYKLPVKQFIFYVGNTRYDMSKTEVKAPDYHHKHQVWDIGSYDYEELLASTYPEEVLLSIHGNFKGQTPESVVRKIIQRLKELANNRKVLEKYVSHLAIMSNLRKLEDTVIKISTQMEVLDEKQFPSYKRGETRGEKRKARELAIKQIRRGLIPDEIIAEDFDLSLSEIKTIRNKLKEGKDV